LSGQTVNEIIKALAYGESSEQIAAAEGVTVAEIEQVRQNYATDVEYERTILRKAGYIDD
jgi:uncharacterized protein (DUF433 family)